MADLEPIWRATQVQYPERRERVSWAATIDMQQDKPVQTGTAATPDGLMITAADHRQVFQARLDGFTFSRLRPYQDWGHLRSEAQRLWAVYCRHVHPSQVTRLAVRYINRMELPLPLDFKDFVLTTPEIASSLPQGLATFFMRLAIPFSEQRAVAMVSQTMEPAEGQASVFYIFDIDVFTEQKFDPHDERIWEVLDGLRTVKNQVFFESLTERALELFT